MQSPRSDVVMVMPHGALGGDDDDDPLSVESMCRTLSLRLCQHPGEWADKYGTDYDDGTLMIHRYCWCEEDTCPWCGCCTCPRSRWHYWIGDREVAYEEWVAEYRKSGNRLRRETSDPATCRFCLVGPREHGGGPGVQAPNLWHRPSGLKVWWYKYIGRSEEVKGDGSAANVARILDAYSPERMPMIAGNLRRRAVREARQEKRERLRAERCARGRHRWDFWNPGLDSNGKEVVETVCFYCRARKGEE